MFDFDDFKVFWRIKWFESWSLALEWLVYQQPCVFNWNIRTFHWRLSLIDFSKQRPAMELVVFFDRMIDSFQVLIKQFWSEQKKCSFFFWNSIWSHRFRHWSQTSFDYFNDLIFSSKAATAGISQISGYQLFNEPRPDPSYKDIIYHFRYVTENELKTFPDRYKFVAVRRKSTFLCFLAYFFLLDTDISARQSTSTLANIWNI